MLTALLEYIEIFNLSIWEGLLALYYYSQEFII